MTAKEREQQEAIKELKKFLKRGMTIYTILRHVSQTGMSRRISLMVIKNNEPYFIDHLASKALDYRRQFPKEGLVVSGCGMDMGFHLVNSLSYALHGMKGNKKHRGGYSFNHRWL